MNQKIISFLTSHKSVLYSSKMFIASVICWYGLKLCGVENPIWSVITVFVVSDPSLTTTLDLSKVRVLNTVVGCVFGLGSIYVFGYSPIMSLITAAVTVMFVNLLERYPVNWRLAPVTVIVLMDAGRMATTPTQEIQYVMMRLLEIVLGCAVALTVAGAYTKFFQKNAAVMPLPDAPADETKPADTTL